MLTCVENNVGTQFEGFLISLFALTCVEENLRTQFEGFLISLFGLTCVEKNLGTQGLEILTFVVSLLIFVKKKKNSFMRQFKCCNKQLAVKLQVY